MMEWYGVFAPAAIPAATADMLNAEISRVFGCSPCGLAEADPALSHLRPATRLGEAGSCVTICG